MSDEPQNFEPKPRRRSSFWRSMTAVFWSFFGVRKGKHHEEDIANLNPVQVILAGLVGAALFVLMLILIVRTVVN